MDQKILEQLQYLLKEALKNVATKDDLAHEIKALKQDMITKRDLKIGLDDLASQITVIVDTRKANRDDVEKLETRVIVIEDTLNIPQKQ